MSNRKPKYIAKRLLAALLCLAGFAGLLRRADAAMSAVQIDNSEIIYNYLTNEMGLNTAAACGVMANIYCECSYTAYAADYMDTNNKVSAGICMWNGSNCTRMKDYCSSRSLNWHDLGAQLDYLSYDLKYNFPTLWGRLCSIPDTAEGAYYAGYIFCFSYERPANTCRKADQRGTIAKTDDNFWPTWGNGRSSFHGESSFALRGASYPQGYYNRLLSAFTLKGQITSQYPLTNVHIYVADHWGNMALSYSQSFGYRSSGGACCYDIELDGADLNPDGTYLRFGRLPVGDYNYCVEVTDTSGTTSTLLVSRFILVADIPTCNGVADGSMENGVHRVVANVSATAGVQWVQFAISSPAGETVVYNANAVGSDYIVDFPLSNHGCQAGIYTAQVYAWDAQGTSHMIQQFQFVVSQDELPAPPVCIGHDDGPMGNGIHRLVAHVTADTGVQQVQFAVWNSTGTLNWYTANAVGDDYIYDMDLADYDYLADTYHVHVYAWDSFGTSHPIDAFDFTVADDELPSVPVCNGTDDGSMGNGVHRLVANVSNASRVQFAVWNSTGTLNWYTANAVDDDYIYDMDLADYDYLADTYHVHVYAWDSFGTSHPIDAFDFTVTDDELPSVPVCNGTADGPMGNGVHRLVANVSNASRVQFAVWNSTGTLNWYTANAVDDDYIYDMDLADYDYLADTYHVHVYAWDSFGTSHPIDAFDFTVADDELPSVPVCNGTADGPMGNGVHRLVANVSNASRVQFAVWSDAESFETAYWSDAVSLGSGDYIYDIDFTASAAYADTYYFRVYAWDALNVPYCVAESTFSIDAYPLFSVSEDGIIVSSDCA